MTLIKVRCSTPTPRGVCNRWQFRLDALIPDGFQVEYRCAHCKETTLTWSSQLKREAASAIR